MSQPYLQVDVDRVDEINRIIKSFKRDAVLVGIPEGQPSRESDDKKEQPIGNAAILFINTFGSEEAGIPPRPVLEIGLKNAQDQIAEEFSKAAVGAMDKGVGVLLTYYNRIGTIASNSVKRAINSQEGIQEPADSTIKSRRSRNFMGTKALIVTGQLRNAITYVVQWSF